MVLLLYNSKVFFAFLPPCFSLMAIQQCELVLIHIYPQGEDTLVTDRAKKEVNLCLPVRHDRRWTRASVTSHLHFLLYPVVSDLAPAHQRGPQRSCRTSPGRQTQHSGPAALRFGLDHHNQHPHEGKIVPAVCAHTLSKIYNTH